MTLIYALVAIGALALIFGLILGYAAIKYRVESNPIVEQLDAVLPQTQCGQCGYPGCRPYAEAIANGDEVNKCPPGGEATVKKLADLMGVEAKPLAGGEEADPVKKVAYIREDECIGCTKCIQACPVDAIVGATRQMHTVIADECTGCDLCVEPCPVDCIDMIPVAETKQSWKWQINAIPVKQLD
ncbi:electron transport complex subunit RsxB [Pseudoalteromonas luteoviolacea]|uniref:Ion-translocating oxidoreductase complex subunit B n=1 Tax=Pseudoalteromonas luteoviolacea DSM 6061 TaxID=1365250 RepID=A0A166VFJ4_9GAMM|nr:electron transport complex subunit RsxB [Pseudoalteromonas luteoviolacea]KZN32670.1 electron transporter RnfB [Pseudoalteromonas luteoviolacea DSM 6061]KZN49136.1 electron transporter RnfB [Pseudoalteromonas luteoviolacea CPMOR-2]MBE0387170.1 electron transport complex protein RnfB [Pseudoalteromonas luteoviolacea DSM 6061]MBQ4814295.1 electron transport complex subunit RsxB [Pseudoalteromonas luteoviolacea]TQF72010.1 electron transport complex subunit RsxB [Pseudoalteromonas luteoviolacea]